MPMMAATKMIALNPKDCQEPEITYSLRNQAGDPIKLMALPPLALMMLLTMPLEGERKLVIMPTTTTVEMK